MIRAFLKEESNKRRKPYTEEDWKDHFPMVIIINTYIQTYPLQSYSTYSTINLRFNAFLKIEIVLLSFKVRS